MAVATINGYWDALTGAALSGRNKSVLLLANDYATLPLADFAFANHQNIARVYIYGGESAVSGEVASTLRENLS